ncbi:MAG: hypothetical protein OWV35_09350 [Firmicutes bacterium]|nr:hypothetical protein [Bacillota bacterium]
MTGETVDTGAWRRILQELLGIEGVAVPPDRLPPGPPGDPTDPTRVAVPRPEGQGRA